MAESDQVEELKEWVEKIGEVERSASDKADEWNRQNLKKVMAQIRKQQTGEEHAPKADKSEDGRDIVMKEGTTETKDGDSEHNSDVESDRSSGKTTFKDKSGLTRDAETVSPHLIRFALALLTITHQEKPFLRSPKCTQCIQSGVQCNKCKMAGRSCTSTATTSAGTGGPTPTATPRQNFASLPSQNPMKNTRDAMGVVKRLLTVGQDIDGLAEAFSMLAMSYAKLSAANMAISEGFWAAAEAQRRTQQDFPLL
jgi:hypothetical protein